MDIIDAIKDSLESNLNLDDSIKTKLFELIIIFHNKLPNINLDRFNQLVKTVKIGRIGKFETRGTSIYDVKENKILFSPDRLKIDYDLDNLFMRVILGMITSTGEYTGFNSDYELMSLNKAYEEILATYLIGNEEISDQEEEMVITNLIGNIIGTDTLFNAYFKNDGNSVKRALMAVEGSL